MGWVSNATPQPLYLLEREPYPLYRRLGGPQGPSGRYVRMRTEKNWLRIVTIGSFF